MRKTDGRLYILIATRIYYSYSPHFPLSLSKMHLFHLTLPSLYFAIYILFPRATIPIFSRRMAGREYTRKCTRYTCIFHMVYRRRFFAQMFSFGRRSIGYGRKEGGSWKYKAWNDELWYLDLIYSFLFSFFFFFLPLIITLTSSRKIHITRVNLLFEIIYSLIEEFSEKKKKSNYGIYRE